MGVIFLVGCLISLALATTEKHLRCDSDSVLLARPTCRGRNGLKLLVKRVLTSFIATKSE